jgi:hypothetical protein
LEIVDLCNTGIVHIRTSTTTLKEAVPEIGSYSLLKAQFDWLIDGQVSHLVQYNLGRELKNMEMFLRYRKLELPTGKEFIND